jgi:hypothetical protein
VSRPRSARLGPLLTEHLWPLTIDRSGRKVNLSLIGPEGQVEADKMDTTPLQEGWAALHDGASDQGLAFTFDPKEVPLVGHWANRSGRPTAPASIWPLNRAAAAPTAPTSPCRAASTGLSRRKAT